MVGRSVSVEDSSVGWLVDRLVIGSSSVSLSLGGIVDVTQFIGSLVSWLLGRLVG